MNSAYIVIALVGLVAITSGCLDDGDAPEDNFEGQQAPPPGDDAEEPVPEDEFEEDTTQEDEFEDEPIE